MVGYAYSVDADSGYNYITIKSYNSDDLSFVGETSSHQIYRLCRKSGAVEFVNPDKTDVFRDLSYKNINDIYEMLVDAEYKRNYPVVLSWSINASGICEKKKTEDLHTVWPLTPYQLQSENGYINITDSFFNKNPLYLKSSFVCEVINEVACYCGVYTGDMVSVLGDEIFCTFNSAFLVGKIFGDESLCVSALKFLKPPEAKLKKIKTKNIIHTIENKKINLSCDSEFPAMELCLIKNQCIKDVLDAVCSCLEKRCTLEWLVEKLNIIFSDAFDRIYEQKDDFVLYSSGMASSDMNYLAFNELMMTFSFGSFKSELLEIVKTNKTRKHYIKNLNRPKIVYDGILYYDY
ncbi:MAG: hypothetical protein IKJ68_10140 [Clostridia bacterium]|nr:hypothetical protein [Clostridia bacterium]